MFIWDNNTLFVLFLQLTMARTKLRLSYIKHVSYILKRKGIGVSVAGTGEGYYEETPEFI